MKTYILVSVLSPNTDCSLHGITSNPNISLFVEVDGGNFTQSDIDENINWIALEPVKRHSDNIPLAFTETNDGLWRMFGGNFVHTSDSRFSKKYGHPIPVHDRIEN